MLLLALPLSGCATRKVPYDQIEDRVSPSGELLPYLKGEAEPFSGIIITYHDNGLEESEESYRSGIRHGACRSWYPSGQIQDLTVYANGSPNGKDESWHENGQREHLGHTRDGQFIGELVQYHPNGRLKYKSWTDDEGNTTKEIHWYPSGQKRCVRIWEDNGWTYLEEWNEDGTPMIGTAEQRNALDS